MKRIVKLNESDLERIVRRIIKEGTISKTVTIDCTKKTIDGLPTSDAQYKKYCDFGGGKFSGSGAGGDW